jgi:hypothetical protein
MGMMNPFHAKHMAGTDMAKAHSGSPTEGGKGGSEHSTMPQIHIHTHAKGHTVHIMHPNGHHEKHEHAHGDVDGMHAHLEEHLGGGGLEPSAELHTDALPSGGSEESGEDE